MAYPAVQLLPFPVGALLQAILTVQFVRYFRSPLYRRDTWATKYMVIVSVILNVAVACGVWGKSVQYASPAGDTTG